MSLYLLCEYGISYHLVKRLVDNGLSIEKLDENPILLDTYFKEKKANEIKNILNKIEDKSKKSIFDLCASGLSLNIVQNIFEDQITYENIKEYFDLGIENKKILKYSQSTLCKIRDSYDKNKEIYDSNNQSEKISDKYKIILYFIENYFKCNYTNKISFEKLLEEGIIDLYENLSELERIINLSSKYYCYNEEIYIKLNRIEDFLNNGFLKENYVYVLKEVLSGQTFADIARKNNLTRERIRQIFSSSLERIPNILLEDVLYKNVFEKYNWDENVFSEVFNEDKYVYYYLRAKYTLGEKDLYEIIGTNLLDDKQEKIVIKYSNLIKYNGCLIRLNKYSLIMAILKNEVKQLNTIEIIKKYNDIVEKNCYDLEKLDIQSDVRTVEGYWKRASNIIQSNKKKIRYYNYDLIDSTLIEKLIEMLDVDNGIYYADYFFDRNKELMQELNLIDANELFSLIRKKCLSEKVNVSIMPIILIGYQNKKDFFDDIIAYYAPIQLEELISILYKKYGLKEYFVRNYLTEFYSDFILLGKINLMSKEFSNEELIILKSKITEDYYSIRYLKEYLKECLNKDCSEYINIVNISKLNYVVRGNYIVRNDIKSIEQLIENYIKEFEIFSTANEKYKNFGATFYSVIFTMINKNELVRISEGKYYTEKKLKQLNISKDRINEFKNKIEELFKNIDFFSVENVRENLLLEEYQELDINNHFIASIIGSIKNFKCMGIDNNYILINKKIIDVNNKADFIEKIILDNKINDVKKVKEFLFEKYKIIVSVYEIKELIYAKRGTRELNNESEITFDGDEVIIKIIGNKKRIINM